VIIGVISDTHSFLDPTIAEHFKSCDEIWHAGDIGDVAVISGLEKIAPVKGVYGNIDDQGMQARFPEDLFMTCEGLSVLISHIGGRPPNYNPRVKKVFKENTPDIFICGHSHILQVKRDDARNMLYINPGAAGQQGFHSMRTILRMEIGDGKIKKMEVIELGKRGQ
jgi:putative phosphoesterase